MIRDMQIYHGDHWEIFIRDDSTAAPKRFCLIVKDKSVEKTCKLNFEIISDMSSTFDHNDVYETLAMKITREFPKLIRKEVIDTLSKLDIIDVANLYTIINDNLLQKIKFE